MKSFLLPFQELTDIDLRSETETDTRAREEDDQRRVTMFATETATGARENESTAIGNYDSLPAMPANEFLLLFQEGAEQRKRNPAEGTMTKTSAREESDQSLVPLFATETITETREQADYTAPIFSTTPKKP